MPKPGAACERAGDGCGEARGVDHHRANHEGLADIGAALLVDDPDQFGLEAAVRRRIGHFEDLLHPVVEALGRAVQQHQRGVAGDELEVMGIDPAARDRQRLGGDRHENHLFVAGDRGSDTEHAGRCQDGAQPCEAVALGEISLSLRVREFGLHVGPPLSRPAGGNGRAAWLSIPRSSRADTSRQHAPVSTQHCLPSPSAGRTRSRPIGPCR